MWGVTLTFFGLLFTGYEWKSSLNICCSLVCISFFNWKTKKQVNSQKTKKSKLSKKQKKKQKKQINSQKKLLTFNIVLGIVFLAIPHQNEYNKYFLHAYLSLPFLAALSPPRRVIGSSSFCTSYSRSSSRGG